MSLNTQYSFHWFRVFHPKDLLDLILDLGYECFSFGEYENIINIEADNNQLAFSDSNKDTFI